MQLCGAGRGSAAGSLISYVLDITQVDPIKYGLQFERFIRRGPVVGEAFLEELNNTKKVKEVIKICLSDMLFFLTPETSIKIMRDGKLMFVTAASLKKGDDVVAF